jgi:hypothetical protein
MSFSDEVELHRIYAGARENRNAYFEKLALLDGGTVALVITAVLGPLHGQITHKYLLGVGLSVLVLALLLLLRRNFLAAQFEFHAAANTAKDPVFLGSSEAKKRTKWLTKDIHYTEGVGVVLSALGILLLLVEVWFLIVATPSAPLPGVDPRDLSHTSPSSLSIGTNVVNQAAPYAQNDRTTNESKSYFSRLFSPENLPNIALVVVGIGGIITAICTLRLIKTQTIDTGIAANAALLNAQAVINTERPWLVVSVHSDPYLANGFFFRITNKGRTPANVVSAYREQKIVDLPDRLRIPPEYSSPMYSPEDNLIVADGKWEDRPSFNPEAVISNPAGAREAFENAAQFLCFYGQVTYRDSFGQRSGDSGEHYTRWCYVYDVSQKRMVVSGPQEYRGKT